MALTEEQLKEIAVCEMRTLGYTGGFDEGFQLIKRFLAALPKLKPVACRGMSCVHDDDWSYDTQEIVGWEPLYTESPIAQPASAPSEQKPVAWNDGVPPHPFDKEWFIAKLDNGKKVVLKALPEEYSYDFSTADETYFKAFRIKCWMQFPESEYIQYAALQPDYKAQRDALLGKVIEARQALQFANDTPCGPINDTIWMMHGPETLFDFLDAAIASVKGGE